MSTDENFLLRVSLRIYFKPCLEMHDYFKRYVVNNHTLPIVVSLFIKEILLWEDKDYLIHAKIRYSSLRDFQIED